MKEKTKVIAYIFRSHQGQKQVLVFDHQGMPEAGTQVVGGTVEKKEDFFHALIREVKEESGLLLMRSDLQKIGETTYHRKDRPEINHRHYFRIESLNLPDSWSHVVQSDGDDNGLIFEFYWLQIKEAKERLVGDFGELL